MNELRADPRTTCDAIAIAIQQLRARGKADEEQPLVRLDFRTEAARAPFQFDSAQGKLHRTGCLAIPENSKPALYALWEVEARDLRFACGRCQPMTKDNQPAPPPDLMDLAYGVLSVVDQFRSILFERGRQYRQSLRGRKLEPSLTGIFAGLGEGQAPGANPVLSAMDNLLRALNACNQSLKVNGNGSEHGNGKTNGAAHDPPPSRRQHARNGAGRLRLRKEKTQSSRARPKNNHTASE